MKKLVVALLSIVSLSGCDVSVSKPSQSTAANIAASLRYIQDGRTGLCYAVVSSHRATDANDSSMTITWVPCEPKVLAEIGK